MPFRCVIHGSFRKHLPEIRQAIQLFTQAGIEVLAPTLTEISSEKDGFVLFNGEQDKDFRLIELLYLHHLKKLGREGFSYFVNPEGYIGKTTSYELGIAQVTNVPCFFQAMPVDHPAYIHKNTIWNAANLAQYIVEHQALPEPLISRDEEKISQLWQDIMVPGSMIATGAIIRHESNRQHPDKDLLFVKTHKWGNRYSMIGGKVKRNETLHHALRREILEESGLHARVDEHLCTFDQMKNSGYYNQAIQHVFVDYAVSVDSKKVTLNEEAEDYVWMPATQALRDLNIEPNARHTLQLYAHAIGIQPKY